MVDFPASFFKNHYQNQTMSAPKKRGRRNRNNKQRKKGNAIRKNNKKNKRNNKQKAAGSKYERIMKLMDISNEWMDNDKRQSIYSFVCKYYDSENLNKFMNDYKYIIDTMDINQFYIALDGKCNVSQCLSLKRNYRNTMDLSKENKRRKSLYYGSENERDIVLIQHLDVIHNILYHTIQCGLRYQEEMEQNDDANKHSLKMIKEQIISKRAGFDRINNYDHKKNKFVTYFGDDSKQKKENDDDDKNDDNEYIVYSQGVRFFYHEKYKYIHKKAVKIPGYKYYESTEDGKMISYWFIIPKYKDFKTELLQNAMFTFSVQQWMNTEIKSKWKWNQYKKTINRANTLWFKSYGFKENDIIGIKHKLRPFIFEIY